MVAVVSDDARFEVEYIATDGRVVRDSLPQCWHVRFEQVVPMRSFPSFKGQHNFPGWYWAATTGSLVGFESWLERDRVMAADFDPQVVGIASQPFWLHWRDGRGARRHLPDYFLRRGDGGVVVDVRADDRIEPRDAEAFEATAVACAQAGWGFERVGQLDAVFAANVRWLSRYRHPRCGRREDLAARLVEVFGSPCGLMRGADRAGDRLAVLPVLYHLMWRRVLCADLVGALLGPGSMVSCSGGAL